MPCAITGVAVMAECADVETPIEVRQATLKPSDASVLPTMFSGVPPGFGQLPTCTGGGTGTAIPTKAGSWPSESCPRGMSEMRSPGTRSWTFLPKIESVNELIELQPPSARIEMRPAARSRFGREVRRTGFMYGT